jgi:hypothetical protein
MQRQVANAKFGKDSLKNWNPEGEDMAQLNSIKQVMSRSESK